MNPSSETLRHSLQLKTQTEARAQRISGRAQRRRMADLIVNYVSATGAITRDDLLGNFTDEQIEAHFRGALLLARIPGVS